MRRLWFGLLLAALLAAQTTETITGELKQLDSGPVLLTQQGELAIDADPQSTEVLLDKRLEGMVFEARGTTKDAKHFHLGEFHTKPLRVIQKDGVKKEVTYWCEVCGIRTYTPGLCVCCREETALDLRVPEKK